MSSRFSVQSKIALIAALALSIGGCQSTESGGDGDSGATTCPEVACDSGMVCDETTGACGAEPECASDSECNDATLACREGQCVSKCEGVTCSNGQACDPNTGACMNDNSCTSDDDCTEGSTCENEMCVLPRMGDCTDGSPCADGLTCVNGPVSLCVGSCDSITDCEAFEFCVDTDNVPIAPFAGYIGYCFPNLCQPGGDDFGVAQNTEYLAPCSDRAGDDEAGICFPGDVSGAGVDICVANNGPLSAGDACDPGASWGSEQLCGSGTFCLEPVFGGSCAAVCNVFDDETCEDTNYFNSMNKNACAPFVGGDGFCIPALGAAAGGASCDPSAGELGAICHDNYGCGPANLDQSEFSCNPWCDPASSGVSATYCGEEEYCWTANNGDEVGVCAPTACTSEVQCAEGEICDNATGGCVDVISNGGCIETADCGTGQLCENNACVIGRNGDCSDSDLDCGTGLTCISGGAGAVSMCVADCESNTDCTAFEFCATSSNMSMNPQIAGFFSAFTDHCFPNVCNDTVTSSDQNIAYNAEYFGPCSDRHGNDNAGFCLGPQELAGSRQGVCTAANGPLVEGEACNPQANWGAEDLCGSGTFCPLGADNPVCIKTCNVLSGEGCTETQACGPFFDEHGFCGDATGTAAAGESCELVPGTFTCTDGYGCAPINEAGTEFACQAFCDPDADGSTATYCADTETCTVYDAANPGIGICLP